jgi:putative glutathione S-transferase
MFNDKFDDITGNKLDFYPEKLRQEIDKINDFIYGNINNGVYKVGFATSQNVYDEEVEKLFKALDVIEKILSKQRYLIGNVLTEADWRLWTTLLRFDPVYVGHFKCNIKCIANYPNLSNYIRDLYQIQGIEEVVNMIHIKQHYYTSHPSINPNGIIPAGPDIDYEAAHNRTRFEI